MPRARNRLTARAALIALITKLRVARRSFHLHDVAQFFIPIFFVSVGAAVDLKEINPFGADTRQFFVIGMLLMVLVIVGKLLAGYFAFGRPLRKTVIDGGDLAGVSPPPFAAPASTLEKWQEDRLERHHLHAPPRAPRGRACVGTSRLLAA